MSRLLPRLFLALAAVLLATACQDAAHAPEGSDVVVPAGGQAVVAGTRLRAAPELPEPPDRSSSGAPLRVRIPRLGMDAPVVAITAPGGVLTPPADPQVLGWWSDGAPPGARRGSALVTGHTVSTGGGAMDDLEQLAPGDRVTVTTDGGQIPYAVDSTDVLGKGALAQRARELFDQEVAGRLVLITCEDWNGEVYLSNVVVTASPVL
ncbi:MAG TPA: class F sortase [Nocardioides sp.]|nr:class F sortase [Nocardioides sp.]